MTTPARERGADRDLALLRAYEPVLRFTAGEVFLPMSVDSYVRACTLWRIEPSHGRPAPVELDGDLDPDRLAELGRRHASESLSLRFVSEPLSRREVLRWRRDPARPRFRPSARFAAVGLLGRVVDALVRLSLVFRGRVPGGTASAAGVRYLALPDRDTHPYYGRVTRDGGYVALQYWFLYAMNDWRSSFTGVNDHEADWEQVTVYVAEEDVAGWAPDHGDPPARPAWVAFSSHDETGPDLRRRSDDPDLTWVGHHPVVFVGAGSHSGAYLPGEYLVTVQPPGLQRVQAVFRAVAGRVAPWTPKRHTSTLGIPYVDYRRGDGVTLGPGGDGVTLGPGGDRPWTPVLVDDTTPWVRDYRGLWGLDTSDPLGGERAPAGPRYERAGDLRRAWTDPVGWAALDAEPPTARAARAVLHQRLPEVDEQVAALEAAVDDVRERLRRAHAGAQALHRTTGRHGVHEPADVLAAELARERARLLELRREREAVDAVLTDPLPPPHPHAHLRHRPLPDLDPAKTPGALAHAWSMISVSVLLLGMAAVFLIESTVWVPVLLGLILGVLFVESLARGRTRRFVANSTAVVATIVPVVVLVGAFVLNWRLGVAVVLAVAALALLVANLRDFLAKR
ncbi:hypothetical protein [Thalassiella azotivora]